MTMCPSPLKKILAERNITLKELGSMTGISSRSLEPYMSGRKSFKVASTLTTVKVADALNIDIHQLLN